MRFRLLFLFCLLFITTHAFSANFYKCENSSGKVTFSDKPCPNKSKTTQTGKLNSFRTSGSVGKQEFPDDNKNRDPNSVFMFRAKFSEILDSLSPLRTSITEFYMERGQWPESLGALGIDQKTMRSKYIDNVKLRKKGKLVITLNKKLGEHKTIILDPSPAMGGTKIDWKCTSNFPSSLLGRSELEICESREIY